MSAFKGTPGPWTLERTEHPRGWNVEARDGTYTVAVARDGTGAPENAYNARLIAAAPELLEALQKVAEQLADVECGGCIDAGSIDRCHDTIRAAIAKATGGAA